MLRQISTQPPTNQIDSMSDAQPCTPRPSHKATITYTRMPKLMSRKIKPKSKIRRKGLTLNEVTPSMAKDNILLNGYLLSPACRSKRS